jgi:hypothetical protein
MSNIWRLDVASSPREIQRGRLSLRYYFTSDSVAATGVMPDDEEPRHVHCADQPLVMDPVVEGYQHHPLSRWRCNQCGRADWVQYLPAYIDRRERELPDPSRMPEPPSSPLAWQDYLDEYFIDGLLFLGVHDRPGYPVRDTSVFVLSDHVGVDLAPGREPILMIAESGEDSHHRLPGIRHLTQARRGILLVHGPGGRVARLDARLSEDEKRYVHRWKHTCYSLRPHPCGDDSCQYCRDLLSVEPCPYCAPGDPATPGAATPPIPLRRSRP